MSRYDGYVADIKNGLVDIEDIDGNIITLTFEDLKYIYNELKNFLD